MLYCVHGYARTGKRQISLCVITDQQGCQTTNHNSNDTSAYLLGHWGIRLAILFWHQKWVFSKGSGTISTRDRGCQNGYSKAKP